MGGLISLCVPEQRNGCRGVASDRCGTTRIFLGFLSFLERVPIACPPHAATPTLSASTCTGGECSTVG